MRYDTLRLNGDVQMIRYLYEKNYILSNMIIKIKGFFKPGTIDGATINVRDTNRYKTLQIADVEVTVSPSDSVFSACSTIDFDDTEYQLLIEGDTLYTCKPILELKERFRVIIEKVVRYLKYFYGVTELDDTNEKIPFQTSYMWCDPIGLWHPLIEKRQTEWQPSQPYYVLDDNFLGWMPLLIEQNIEPLFGLSHLHKAFLETNTRHQWIDATTAAELAFKEFLGKLNKDVTPLLTHLPSPPLDKMYGPILEAYTGEKSPMVKCFNEAIKTRNNLIHKPRQAMPSKDRTDVYLHQVQVAIMHLHKLLAPDNALFDYILKRAEEKLNIVQERIAIKMRV